MFDWNLVTSFLAVLDHGSLAAAARATGISQPTLGRHVDEFEQELGVTLFERGRGGMMATETALAVAEQARAMRDASAAIEMAATGHSQSVEGTVRVTASEIVSTYILPGILATLFDDLPGIEIELVASNTVENLLQRDADIAIRMARPVQNDLITRQLNTLEMGIFAHRSYLARKGEPAGFEDLARHVIIGYDRNDLVIRGFQAAGFVVDRHYFRYRCDDQVTAFEAMAAGVGIGFAPRALACRHPELVRLLPDIAIPGLPMWLTSHRELRTSRKIRMVSDYLGERLSAMALG